MKKALVIILLIHFLVYLAIIGDLPIFRQLIVFFYLTFIPGFILLKYLKVKEIKIVDMLIFSVALSLVFVMFSGFFINEVLLAVGFTCPLSPFPLLNSLCIITLILSLIGYRRDLFNDHNVLKNLTLSKEGILKSSIVFLPVIFAIIGALYIFTPIIAVPLLLLMVILISVLLTMATFSSRIFSDRFYPLMIFTFSIALALHIVLMSKYIIGYDAQLEYQIANLTINRGYWVLLTNISPYADLNMAAMTYNSMLSVTVLPSVYQALLNIKMEMIFKILYPLIFSLIPVILYRIYEQQIGRVAAFLAALFFISSPLTFYGIEFLSLNRQIVAFFFLVLSVLILVDNTLDIGKRKILLIIFSVALIMSHYSTGYLYLAFIFFTYVILRITGKKNRVLNGTIVLLISVIGFVWYTFTESPVTSLGNFFFNLYSRFSQDILSTTARAPQVLTTHSILTFASVINWALVIAVHFMIFVGIIVSSKLKKNDLNPTYRSFLLLNSVVILICFAVPNFAPALSFSRFYQLSILFLAPCFVLGGYALVKAFVYLLKRIFRSFPLSTHKMGTILVCFVLVCYFLSQSGFINYTTKAAPYSPSIDFDRINTWSDLKLKGQLHVGYILEEDYFSACWLSKHASPQSVVYADYASRQSQLLGYGVLSMQYLSLSNSIVLSENNIIYLSSLNVKDGVVINEDLSLFNSSEILPILEEKNLLYANGNGEIWVVPSIT